MVWQVTSCKEISGVGSVHLIHGKITTLPAICDTLGRRGGLSEVTISQNGSVLDRVRFFGFMANVRGYLACMRSETHRFPNLQQVQGRASFGTITIIKSVLVTYGRT
jgi:hypothetical protein